MESRAGSISDDDEINQIQRRFVAENLNPSLPAEDKTIHVWRWLVDAELNCKHIHIKLDKIKKQHDDQLEELVMSKKDLEIEVRRLNAELEDENERNAEIVSEEINEMLRKQGLKDLAKCGVSEQFAFLLVERAQMKEELEAEREKQNRRGHTYRMASKLNLTDSLKLSSPQIQQLLEQQKDEFEEELKHQQLMVRNLKQQLKTVHEQEMDKLRSENCCLKSDIDCANHKIEELVRMLSKNDNVSQTQTSNWIYNILNRGLERDFEETLLKVSNLNESNAMLSAKISQLNEDLNKAQKANKMLELDNQNLDFKLSEILYQYSEMEEAVQLEKTRSRRPSIVRSSSIFESPSQIEALHSLFDRKISSAQQDLNLVDQVKRLKLEVLTLENQIHNQGDKYELLARKYQLSKIRHKERLQKIRELYYKEKKSFGQQMAALNGDLSLKNLRITQEETLQRQLKEQLKNLIHENSSLSKRLLDVQSKRTSLSQKLEISNHRLKFVEDENSRLQLAKMSSDGASSSLSCNPRPKLTKSNTFDS